MHPAWGNRLEHGPRVMGQGPELGVELGPQLVGAAIPRPAEIQRELGECLDPDVRRPAHDESPPSAMPRITPPTRRDADARAPPLRSSRSRPRPSRAPRARET